MSLTELAIKNAKPNRKAYWMKDESGLYLEIHPTGKKVWKLRYWISGKEGKIKLGEYPLMSLKEARLKRDEARKDIAVGVKPKSPKRIQEEEAAERKVTFQDVAMEWLEKRKKEQRSEKTTKQIEARLRRYVFPFVGSMTPDEIQAPFLLNVVKRVEAMGIIEMAHRVLGVCGQIFRYAIITGNATRDPSADLKGALITRRVKHFATITEPKEVAVLLNDCEGYSGSEVVKIALKLSPLVFVRPGELRKMEWSEVDFEAARWTLPGDKTKMVRIHIVPLSRQALELLHRLHKITGHGRFAFPSIRTPAGNRPMSDNTVNAALRRLGYSGDEIVAHGFRGMASTLLYENGWPGDVIELQLAHQERNKVKAAYNHAQHLSKRKEMMQWWADYLDELRDSCAPAKSTNENDL
jgi:integrase